MNVRDVIQKLVQPGWVIRRHDLVLTVDRWSEGTGLETSPVLPVIRREINGPKCQHDFQLPNPTVTALSDYEATCSACGGHWTIPTSVNR